MSYTQSSLAAARRCARLYGLRYWLKWSLLGDGEREALAVGTCWHLAHRVGAGDPYALIDAHAPSSLWAEKLRRIFAAHAWYWRSYDAGAKLVTTATEGSFKFEWEHREWEGQIDERLVTPDGRTGIMERKTTSDSLSPESDYWKKLRMDVQCGLYGLAAGRPDFILYDVVRKPALEPKLIAQKDRARMLRELEHGAHPGFATYFGEEFPSEVVLPALEQQRENEPLYGARLTADIGDRPDHYFARREVSRTAADYEALQHDLLAQAKLIELQQHTNLWPRNPDACNQFGTCEFFRLCSNNYTPHLSNDAPRWDENQEPPTGYVRREHLHPELAQDNQGTERS